MVKCELCKEKVGILFLGKIEGTYLRDGKKLKADCSACQKRSKNKLDVDI